MSTIKFSPPHNRKFVMAESETTMNGAPRCKLNLPSRRIDVCGMPVTFMCKVRNWEDALLEHAFMTNMNEAKCQYA